jgi:NitT/TauT family transport system substrate-binding protein
MRVKIAAAVICAALGLAGAAGAQQKTTVVLGVSGRPDQAGLELALDRGYFTRQGLDIKTVQATGGPEFVSSLATDQIQVASGSPNPGLFNALNRGIDIRIVADFAHYGDATDRALSLLVREDLMDSGAVKTPADLKGRTVNIGPGGPGQVPDVLFTKIFDPYGISHNDVKLEYINFPDLLAAFASKSLDAGFQIEPLVTAAEVRKIARVLVTGGSVYPGGELSVVYYSPAFARNKDAATKFMIGYLEGVRDYYDAFFLGKNKDATIDLLIQHLPLKDPKIWAISRQFTDLNGKVNVADLKFQAGVYKKLGMISGDVPDIDKYVDPQFAEAAVKAIGERQR